MVDAYATSLGGLTLAVNGEHFIMEESLSNSILELRPAISLADKRQPVPFRRIEGFSTASNHMQVTWKPEQNIAAVTTLSVIQPNRLKLETQIRNLGANAVSISAIFPLSIPAEGPGACALGMHELRTLASARSGQPLQYVRAHGQDLHATGLLALFGPSGNPSLLIAALEPELGLPESHIAAARGKIIALDISARIPYEILEAGAIFDAPPLLLALGNSNVLDGIQEWRELAGDSSNLIAVPEFNPSENAPDLVVEEEIPEETLEAEIPEEVSDEDAASSEEEMVESLPNVDASGADDETSPLTPAPLPQERENRDSDLAEPRAGNAGEAGEEIVEQQEEESERQPEGSQPVQEQGIPLSSNEEADAVSAPAEQPKTHRTSRVPAGRCASFRRALRVSEGVWPRWGMGRRYATLEGGNSRTRYNWRWKKPQQNGME